MASQAKKGMRPCLGPAVPHPSFLHASLASPRYLGVVEHSAGPCWGGKLLPQPVPLHGLQPPLVAAPVQSPSNSQHTDHTELSAGLVFLQ